MAFLHEARAELGQIAASFGILSYSSVFFLLTNKTTLFSQQGHFFTLGSTEQSINQSIVYINMMLINAIESSPPPPSNTIPHKRMNNRTILKYADFFLGKAAMENLERNWILNRTVEEAGWSDGWGNTNMVDIVNIEGSVWWWEVLYVLAGEDP